jgi:NAD dependent epimerase/dehydratase family enzyme
VLRIGFVLRWDGGALKTLVSLTRWGLGGRVGNGRQYISWIHYRDMNRMFFAAIEDSSMGGIYNATGLNPVTNADFMRELRHALHRPWSPPTPAWATHIGAALMGTEACLALTGRRCLPKRFQQRGFEFEFTDLALALRDITTKPL